MVKDMIERELDNIIKNFDRYDGRVESGIDIIQSNQISFDRLKELLNNEDIDREYTYLQTFDLLIKKQNKFIKIFKDEKKELLKKIKEINMKNKVVNNYMATGIRPIFIDKNM